MDTSVPQPRGRRLPLTALGVVRSWAWLVFPLTFAVILFGDDEYWQYVAGLVVIYALSALGLDWLMGRAGIVSLGNGAIMAFGALAASILSHQPWGVFPVTLLAVTVLGGMLGAVVSLAALRLHGVYFALVTLALHFVVIFGVHQYQKTDSAFVGGVPVGVPELGSLELEAGRKWLAFLGVVLVVVVLLLRNVYARQPGRMWMAVRENELAAKTIGVRASHWKLSAFVGSSALIALSGALLAYYIGRVSADSYTLQFAITFVVMVIVGGLRSLGGALFGTILVTTAPLVLGLYAQDADPTATGLTGWFRDNVFFVNTGIFGLLVLVVLLYLPDGVVPTLARAADRFLLQLGRPGAAGPPAVRAEGPVVESALLQLRGVDLVYSNGAWALNGLNLTVGEHDLVAIVGRNGVGKTSLMRAITGFFGSEGVRLRGSLRFDGAETLGSTPLGTARRGVILVPEREKVFADLTVEEHLRHVGDLAAARAAMPHEWPLFERRWDSKAGLLSGGERQLLALAVAASLRPRLLLIDEMSLGLAPVAIDRVVKAIRELHETTGLAVIVVEQNVEVARRLTERVYLMEDGELTEENAHVARR
ncbi:ATP-binding cassette domain-containing protein [Streptosporangium sp. NPDC006013]|uniref:ABC transporter permease subunit n=1 Tax=Streptosporangium sp. NPDC006013 TaxID=3155596 RepID=UPI0033B2F995